MTVETQRRAKPRSMEEWKRSVPDWVREHFEVVDGRWLEKPVAGWDHGDVMGDIKQLLKAAGLKTSVDVIVHLPTGNEVHPDVAAVRADNPVQPGHGPYHGVPDVAVEVLSDSTKRYDRGDKLSVYAEAGVRHYWLVDPETRDAELYVLEGPPAGAPAEVKDDYVLVWSGSVDNLTVSDVLGRS